MFFVEAMDEIAYNRPREMAWSLFCFAPMPPDEDLCEQAGVERAPKPEGEPVMPEWLRHVVAAVEARNRSK